MEPEGEAGGNVREREKHQESSLPGSLSLPSQSVCNNSEVRELFCTCPGTVFIAALYVARAQ